MRYKSDAEYEITGRAVLLSDLHLKPEDSGREELLRKFIETRLSGAEHLFILGDLFEFWIGGKHVTGGEFGRVIRMLRAVVDSGIPVTILKGNRDFYMGRELTRAVGAEILNDGFTLRANGRRIYVCHGDTFCTRDRGYLRLRAVLRNPVMVGVYRSLPSTVAYFLANGYRQTSKRVGPTKQNGKTSIVLNAVEGVLDTGYDAVICGHVHTPRNITLQRDDGEKTLVILGDWSERGWYIEVEKDRLELLHID